MRLFKVLGVLCVLSAAPAQAAVLLNFDELTAGTVLDDEYAALGVMFSNSAGNLLVSASTPADPPFSSPNSILPANFNTLGNYNEALFSTPVSAVSVVLGDFNADADNLFLQVFNAANVLIGSDSDFLPAPEFGGRLLSVAVPDIAYARFFGVGVNNNSVFFDNFSFEAQAVPEPATLLLVGIAGVGVVGRRLRREPHKPRG